MRPGMMVSFIQSNFMGFGSGVVVQGISLQNRGSNFVLEPGHPNCVGPRKRPYQTIIPGFVTKNGRPVMSFGVMGGTMQPQGHTQVMVRIADYEQSPQAACDGPRFRIVQGMQVSVEEGASRGHAGGAAAPRPPHRNVDDYNQFGSAQLIWKLDGGYYARAIRGATGRPSASDAEDLGPWQLGQRQEGAVGARGARPQVRAHQRRHGTSAS
jgi:gamma-glutamyltranspeptidase/glutathione hydrolase